MWPSVFENRDRHRCRAAEGWCGAARGSMGEPRAWAVWAYSPRGPRPEPLADRTCAPGLEMRRIRVPPVPRLHSCTGNFRHSVLSNCQQLFWLVALTLAASAALLLVVIYGFQSHRAD